jgi:hypothetical protein
MLTLYKSLKKILPEIVDAVVKFNETGSFPGFDKNDPRNIIKTFDGIEINSNYDFHFRFYESDEELDIKIREGGQLVIDIGVPAEKISKDIDIIEAIKEEIDLLLCHWESVLDEFEE